MAAYLKDVGHPETLWIRHWVIPHSPEYCDMLLVATDGLAIEKAEALSAATEQPKEDQLFMFSSKRPGTANSIYAKTRT